MPAGKTTPGHRAGHAPRYAMPAMALIVAGCTAGSGEGLDAAGRPLDEGGDLPLAPTLESLQANLFDPFCTVCHSGAAAPLGLRLDAGNSFNNLVGAQSRQTGLLRVEPGNPDDSYLVRKLEGSAAEGGLMPLGGPRLPQSTIDFVRQWISDGALPGAGGPPTAAASRVTSVNPVPGAVLSSLPAQVDVGFDRDIDAATVNAMTFGLQASGGDGEFDNGNEIAVSPVAVSLSMANPRLATMDLSAAAGSDDDYRLTVRGNGASVVLGVDGRRIDGEFTGSFPSGDGSEGGDFVAGFSVQAFQPTLDSIQAEVFTPTCSVSGCHSGPPGSTLPTGMDLSTADASFAALVNVMSQQDSTLLRVEPGNADNSYLVQKIDGTASVGTRMPQGGQPLDPSTIDTIRAWIDNGALR